MGQKKKQKCLPVRNNIDMPRAGFSHFVSPSGRLEPLYPDSSHLPLTDTILNNNASSSPSITPPTVRSDAILQPATLSATSTVVESPQPETISGALDAMPVAPGSAVPHGCPLLRLPSEILGMISSIIVSSHGGEHGLPIHVPPFQRWDDALQLQLLCKRIYTEARHPSAWFPNRSAHFLFPFHPNNPRGRVVSDYLDITFPVSGSDDHHAIQIQLSSDDWHPDSIASRERLMEALKETNSALSIRCSDASKWPTFAFDGLHKLLSFSSSHICLAPTWDAPQDEDRTLEGCFEMLSHNEQLKYLSLEQVPARRIPSSRTSKWTLAALEELRLRYLASDVFEDCMKRLCLPALRLLDVVCVTPWDNSSDIPLHQDTLCSVTQFRWWSEERKYAEEGTGPLVVLLRHMPHLEILTLQRVRCTDFPRPFLPNLFHNNFHMCGAPFLGDLTTLIFKSCEIAPMGILEFVRGRAFIPCGGGGIRQATFLACTFDLRDDNWDIQRFGEVLQLLVETLEISNQGSGGKSSCLRWERGANFFMSDIIADCLAELPLLL